MMMIISVVLFMIHSLSPAEIYALKPVSCRVRPGERQPACRVSGFLPFIKKPDQSGFLTFDTCQRPPGAVRTPRALRAAAIPRRSAMPEAQTALMIGSVFARLCHVNGFCSHK